jgi:hypothetical protein
MSITPDQRRAANLLSQGLTPNQVGRQIGVSGRTVLRWKTSNSEFSELLKTLNSQARNLTIQNNLDSLQEDEEKWRIRRQDLREKEWELSGLLLAKAEKLLKDNDIEISPRQLPNILEVGFELARRSSELWDNDLNAAIALVRRYNFDVVDRQRLDEENEVNDSDY